jgi:hypothetical protein
MQPDTWTTLWQQQLNEKTSTPHPASELVRTHAERIAHEAEDRLQKRQLELAEQCSSANSPDVRIRAWERLHALRLPNDPGHPVLRSVAIATGLTLAQVEEEQSVRRARRSASAPTREPGSSV